MCQLWVFALCSHRERDHMFDAIIAAMSSRLKSWGRFPKSNGQDCCCTAISVEERRSPMGAQQLGVDMSAEVGMGGTYNN